MEDQRSGRGWSWFVGIIFVIFFGLLYFQFIDDKLSYIRGSDVPSYILLAKSLASGLGFSDFNLPGNPPHTQYPPLFPLMLAPIISFFGYNFMWMRLLVLAFALASFYVIWLYFSRLTSKVMAYVLVLLVGTNIFISTFSAEILSEIVYLFFSMLALYLYEKNIDRKLPGLYAKYLPLLAPLMYFTKLIGVTICFAVICVLLLRIKSEVEERSLYLRKLRSFFLFGVVPFIVWFFRNSLYATGVSSYQSIMFQADYYDMGQGHAGIGAIFERAIDNISMYVYLLPKTFFTYMEVRNGLPAPLFKVILIIVLVIFLIGFVRELVFKRGIKDFYTLSYLSILMVWPTYGAGDAIRYLVPIVPLIYFYFFRGFEVVTSPGRFLNRGEDGLDAASATRSRRVWILFFPVCIFLLFNFAQIRGRVFPSSAFRHIARSYTVLGENLFKKIESVEVEMATTNMFIYKIPCYHNYLEGAKILTLASGPDDIIMTRKPEVVSLISGRKVIKFPYSSDEKVIFRFIEENRVTHILLDGCYSETKKYILPVIEKYDEKFTAWVTADGKHSGILRLNK